MLSVFDSQSLCAGIALDGWKLPESLARTMPSDKSKQPMNEEKQCSPKENDTKSNCWLKEKVSCFQGLLQSIIGAFTLQQRIARRRRLAFFNQNVAYYLSRVVRWRFYVHLHGTNVQKPPQYFMNFIKNAWTQSQPFKFSWTTIHCWRCK